MTILFLASVTTFVKSTGDLFRQGVSSIFCEKLEKPVVVEMLMILIFIAGVLMAGFSLHFAGKFQSYVPTWTCSASGGICSVNGVTWQFENHEEVLEHRRNEYVLCLGDEEHESS